ncbi:MAG: beta-ketoacyl-[acyl-carrier-protein] synthase family protein [Bacteroidales bacterium]|jgi:3-oxoacyl-[acyl-carrier-protein] synthase II
MKNEQIVVTGMGVVSAIGNSVAEILHSIKNSTCPIGEIKHLDTINKYPVAEVALSDAEMKQMLNLPEDAEHTRTTLMGILAVQQAIESLSDEEKRTKRVAFINGTTVGGMEKSEKHFLDFFETDEYDKYIKVHDCGSSSEAIADYFGCFSHVSTISTACSSGANSVIMGCRLIENDLADIAVVGGSECLTKFHINGFSTLLILDNEICKPFDKNRAGLNLGEGAAYIVLQKASDVKPQDKGKILCKVSGYSNTCDAYHQTASSPEGEGAYLAMQNALINSNLKPQDIDYISAHGTGTPNNDLSEGISIQRIFGDNIPPVSSTKSLTGHTTSASGAIEAIISILALNEGFIPPNYNFKEKMPELNFAPQKEIESRELKNVLSNSFGFGGNNTSIIFSLYN